MPPEPYEKQLALLLERVEKLEKKAQLAHEAMTVLRDISKVQAQRIEKLENLIAGIIEGAE
jgi:hypothetical protein